MSFDLLVFDLHLAPTKDEEFEEWYKSLVPVNYYDPKTSSPALQVFFEHLSKTFPSMGWLEAGDHEPIREVGIFARLIGRLLRMKSQPKSARELPEDFDEVCFTAYGFCKAAIYLGFAWSVSEQALHATIDAAIKSRVGFYYEGANGDRPIRKRQDLIALKNQLLPLQAPKFTKADLFKMLKEDGWTVTRGDEGPRYATRVEEGKVFRLYPDVRNTPESTCIEWRQGVAPLKYVEAISIIDDRPCDYFPLHRQSSARLEAQNLTLEMAKVELKAVIAKLREEDLAAALNEIANRPWPSAASLEILAVKACRGEYFDLYEFRDEMKLGNRYGTLPYITIEHLDRAITACVQLNEELS